MLGLFCSFLVDFIYETMEIPEHITNEFSLKMSQQEFKSIKTFDLKDLFVFEIDWPIVDNIFFQIANIKELVPIHLKIKFGQFIHAKLLEKFGKVFEMIGETPYDFFNNINGALLYAKSLYSIQENKIPLFSCYRSSDNSLFVSVICAKEEFEPMIQGFLMANMQFNFQPYDSISKEKEWNILDHKIIYHIVPKNLTKISYSSLHINIPDENKELVSRSTMSRLIPFNFTFNKNGQIIEIGDRLHKMILNESSNHEELYVNNIFEITEPKDMEFDYQKCCCLPNILFAVRIKQSAFNKNNILSENFDIYGQMIKLEYFEVLWFVGYPRFESMNELDKSDLCISDIPNQGNARTLLLMKEQEKIIGDGLEYNKKMQTDLENLQRDLKKEMTNTKKLLYEIFPKNVANELVAGRDFKAVQITNTFILFSDIVGFTNMSSKSSAMEVTEMLNILFTEFDNLCAEMNLFKIETIGDAYVVSSGVHEKHLDDAERIVLFGLKIIEASNNILDPTGTKINIRVGIHVGDTVAGIVGNRSPRYCLFGHTVQTANKIESLSKPNKCTVSLAIKDVLTELNCKKFLFQDHVNMIETGQLHIVTLI